jgi:hypothetical protein
MNEFNDISCNPKYEDLENEEIEKLHEKNDAEYLADLLLNEVDTAEFFSTCDFYPQYDEFAQAVFSHFRSQRMYLAIERHFCLCAEGSSPEIIESDKEKLEQMRKMLDSGI